MLLAMRFLLMAALIVIQHCYIHTERDTNYPTTGGPGDLYEYMVDGQPKLCAEIDWMKDGTWKATNEPNRLTKAFTSRTAAKAWVTTLCQGAPDDAPR
jgi:hypothetical protein